MTSPAKNRTATECIAMVNRFKGLSDSAFNVLYALYEQDGQRQLELCKTSLMPKQTLASALKRLTTQDLVRIENESRRVSRVFLTEKGRQQAEAVIAPLVQAEIAATRALPPEMLQQLPRILSRYLETLSAGFDAL